MRAAGSTLLVVCAVAICQPWGDALAQGGESGDRDVVLAKKYFDLGQELYQRSDYRGALKQFEQAYALSQRPALLFNIARCYESLGDNARAINYYQKFLLESGSTPSAAEAVQGRIDRLWHLMKKHQADEQRRRSTSAKGREHSAASQNASATGSGESLQRPGRAQPGRPLRTSGWILVGSGGALLITGIVLAVLAKSRQSSLEEAAARHEEWALHESGASQGRAMQAGGIVCLSLGGAAAATGGVLLVLDRRQLRSEPTSHVWISPTFTPRGAVLAAGLQF